MNDYELAVRAAQQLTREDTQRLVEYLTTSLEETEQDYDESVLNTFDDMGHRMRGQEELRERP
jgi:hypothetical protein